MAKPAVAETIDGEFVETTALAVRSSSAAPAAWVPTFAIAVDEAVEKKRQKRRFFEEVMDKDLHYGAIPGTGSKPTLLKPGAEMLLSNMGLNPSLSLAEPPIVDVTGADHGGEAYIRYRSTCRIYRQTGPGENDRMIVAEAGGSCSSWETKYRYRNDQRKCPECGKPTIIKGKKEFGGGFICWKKEGKSDGCGAKFKENDPTIIEQPIGKIANPDVAELENTILKMADKRALIAATLLATGCSDIFTQDVEDFEPPSRPPQRDEETQHDPEPRPAQGPSLVSSETLERITKGFATLGLDAPQIVAKLKFATRGRMVDPDALKTLTEEEGLILSRDLVAAYKAKIAAQKAAPCEACGAKADEDHVYDKYGVPCPEDMTAEAIKNRALASERAVQDEIPLT